MGIVGFVCMTGESIESQSDCKSDMLCRSSEKAHSLEDCFDQTYQSNSDQSQSEGDVKVFQIEAMVSSFV